MLQTGEIFSLINLASDVNKIYMNTTCQIYTCTSSLLMSK